MTNTSDDALVVPAAAIVDIWMGGDQSWRSRLDDSDFLESADWQNALNLARAALAAMRSETIPMLLFYPSCDAPHRSHLCHSCGTAIEKGAAMRDDGWRAIESAPKDGTTFLAVANGADNRPLYAIVSYVDPETMFSSVWVDPPPERKEIRGVLGHRYGVEFTHYQPLPPPPGSEPVGGITPSREAPE